MLGWVAQLISSLPDRGGSLKRGNERISRSAGWRTPVVALLEILGVLIYLENRSEVWVVMSQTSGDLSGRKTQISFAQSRRDIRCRRA